MQNKIKLSFVIVIGLISACANYNPDGHYSSQGNSKKPVEDLVVPPGLNSVEANSDYNIPKDTAVKYQINNIKDMKIIQGGSQRWLQINNNNVDSVWDRMLSYLEKQGFTIHYENKSIGIIQTDWATQNNTVPQTGIRGLFEYIGWGSMYSMSSQYNFKITLWQDGNSVNVFVTNSQMNQVYPNCKIPNNNSANYSSGVSNQQITTWMAVPSDPQLELNFLLQFMGFNGFPEEQIRQIKANNLKESLSYNKYIVDNKIIVQDSFDTVWWRSAIALDRIGLGIADKNRELGEFYTYPLQSSVEIPEQGFWQKLFGSKGINLKMPEPQYVVKISQDHLNTVIIINSIDSKNKGEAKKYLDNLAKELVSGKID